MNKTESALREIEGEKKIFNWKIEQISEIVNIWANVIDWTLPLRLFKICFMANSKNHSIGIFSEWYIRQLKHKTGKVKGSMEWWNFYIKH